VATNLLILSETASAAAALFIFTAPKNRSILSRKRLVVPAAPDLVTKLAKKYVSKDLGEIDVRSAKEQTVFDFGEWKSAVASRKNDDGSISFITIDPTLDGFEFVVGEKAGERTLTVRDGQHEYICTEGG